MTRADDLVDLTLRDLLERLLADRRDADADPWVDLRKEGWPFRRIVAAAKRGECKVSRIGRRLLMRRSELDAWVDRHEIEVETEAASREPPEHIAHLLRREGYGPMRRRR